MRERNHTIELLRFLFAGIVVLHHSRYFLGDENCYFLGGSLAVEFFLFVSGYLLEVSVEGAGEREAAGIRAGKGPCPLGKETLQFIFHKLKGFLPEFLISWVIGFAFLAAVRRLSPGQIWDAFRNDFWELTLVKMSGLFTHGINGAMWYLSAMLLVMAVLYPLLRKYEDVMTHIICPLAALFLYGWLCQEYGHPRDPVVWTGLCYKGILRTAAGLCAGVVSRKAAERCRRRAPRGLTAAGNVLAALFQLAGLFLAVRYMMLGKPSEEDYFFMFLLLLVIVVTFAGWGMERICRKAGPAADFLGKWSLPLYLGHLYYAQHINEISALAALPGTARTGIYAALAIGNSLVIMGAAALWRHSRGILQQKLGKVLISGFAEK